MDRFLAVESAFLAQPIKQRLFMGEWPKRRIVPSNEGYGDVLRADMAESLRERSWSCLATLLGEVRVSLRSILEAEEPVLVWDGTDGILVDEAGRRGIATNVARALCYAAGASELERDRQKRFYLLSEAAKCVGALGEDPVGRYVEEALFVRHGADIVRSIGC
jgi:hypothetical protein